MPGEGERNHPDETAEQAGGEMGDEAFHLRDGGGGRRRGPRAEFGRGFDGLRLGLFRLAFACGRRRFRLGGVFFGVVLRFLLGGCIVVAREDRTVGLLPGRCRRHFGRGALNGRGRPLASSSAQLVITERICHYALTLSRSRIREAYEDAPSALTSARTSSSRGCDAMRTPNPSGLSTSATALERQ